MHGSKQVELGMKFLFVFFMFIQPSTISVDKLKIEDIRIAFHKASSSEKECRELIQLLQGYNENNNPLFYGYRAGATMVMAKHLFNPFSKFSYFKKGVTMLENAIQHDHKNIELRFLRYTIQTNVPAFLNYNMNKEADKLFLIQSMDKLNDSSLRKIISAYLAKSAKT